MVKLNLGANVDTGECYAIGPNAKEVFKIVKAYEFGHSDVKLSLLKDKWDEDDKENGNKKKQGSKAIQRDGDHTGGEFVAVPGTDQAHNSPSTPSRLPPCCRKQWEEKKHHTSEDCICAAFESCLKTDTFKVDPRTMKPAYFLQISENGYTCLSCHHRTGCQVFRDDCEEENQLNLQAAGRHLADVVCGRRKKKEEGMTANVFLFKWDGKGNLLVSKQFMNFGGRFDYVKFLTLVPTSEYKDTQEILDDLTSRDPAHVNLALQCISKMESREMAEEFCTDLPKLLVSGETIDFVKQSAALCILKLFRNTPESFQLGEYVSRIVNLLKDSHMVS
ncbi:hypothetical protein CAEBREN_07821 [Caenorhabditis brenneri]|uniref:Clathrin/coatomer adaptor adaptin-like N-terminal domain-containing protein n=2 Tax=Caenorhabditis brenneri TaxID=135651 RepID=G0PAS0_CAEBE|nr:hypothetical protein CAEBREN_07821 [Caenorhabditis brenneri]